MSRFRAIDTYRPLLVDFSPLAYVHYGFFFLPLTLPFNVMQFSFGPRAHSKADFANHHVVALEPDPSNLSLWRIRRCKSNRLTVMPRPGQTGFVVTVQGPVFSRITFVRPFKDPCKMDRLD